MHVRTRASFVYGNARRAHSHTASTNGFRFSPHAGPACLPSIQSIQSPRSQVSQAAFALGCLLVHSTASWQAPVAFSFSIIGSMSVASVARLAFGHGTALVIVGMIGTVGFLACFLGQSV